MKKKFLSFIFLLIIVCTCLTGCKRQDLGNSSIFSPKNDDTETAFDSLTNQWLVSQMSKDPLTCHYSLANPESYGISNSSECFSDISYDSFEKSLDEQKTFLNELKNLSKTDLPPRKQMVYDILIDYYTKNVSYDSYYYYENYLSPSSGIPSTLPILLAGFTFRNNEDIHLYFELLDDVDIYLEEIYQYAKDKQTQDLLYNQASMQQTISFCRTFAKMSSDHMLLSSFKERINGCDFLNNAEKQKLIFQNETLVHDVVLPSYMSLSDKLMSLENISDENLCLCQRPDGHRYYALLAQSATGCSDSPFTLYQRIQKRRTQDMKQMAKLFLKDPSLASSISNADCPIHDPSEMIDILQTSISNDFPHLSDVDFTVKQISPELANYSAPAFYLIAPLDACNRHEIFYNPNQFCSSLDLFTTMAHEGFPGHLYQTCMSYTYDYEPVRLLLSYPGYVEGWATYVENLSFSYAGLNENTASVLSLNQSVILSLYASADIGIHYYGWDIDTLQSFLSDYGITDKKVAEKIYNLILNDPANYLKYYVGYLNFVELREECEKKYPQSFSPMIFHKVVLQTGPAPFDLLRQELHNYFESNP